MSLAMLILAAAAQPAEPRLQTRATARILNSAKATETQWNFAERRMDRLVRDELGREVRLRTIDFE